MLTPAAPLRPGASQPPAAAPTAPVEPRPRRDVPLPRTWPIGAAEIVGFLVLNGLLIGAMWIRHGGTEQFTTPAGILTAIGQVTALYGTYLALIQLVLMSRSPWLDQVFGMDGLAVAHRWLGFGTVWLLLGHLVFTTIGYAAADGTNVVAEFLTFVTTYEYVLMATVSAGLFGAIAITLDPRGPPPALVRDLVRHPPVRVSRDRARLPAPVVRRLGLHARPDGRRLLDRPVRRRVRARPRVPCRPSDPAVGPAPTVHLEHRHRGARRHLDLRLGSRPGPPRRPLRPVLRVALPHP